VINILKTNLPQYYIFFDVILYLADIVLIANLYLQDN